MRPLEPDASVNSAGQPSASLPSQSERSPESDSGVRTEPLSQAELPQAAERSPAPSEEPLLATIVEPNEIIEASILEPPWVQGPSATSARPAFTPHSWDDTSSAGLVSPWNANLEVDNDPLLRLVYYGKALFSPEAQEILFQGRELDKIYSVPRRFDLSTLFVVSTAFAILFTLLAYLEFSSSAKLLWCFFFSGVGFAQAALYKGRAPRAASILAGGVLLPLFVATASTEAGVPICLALGMVIVGLPAGYIAGTLIGGVFLVADKLRNRIAQRRALRAV